MTNKTKIKLENISYSYAGNKAVENLSFSLPTGKYMTILGPSGCGKTTILKMIGGYLYPTKGKIYIDDKNVTEMDSCSRKIGMVFQNYLLFPHLSARKNISFPLEIRHQPKNDREKKVDEISELVGLTKKEIERKPSELSGGQQQRVALARALIFEPQLLLLDEPLANLDKELKTQLLNEIRNLQKTIKVTTIMVTHDHEEALSGSDLIGIMNQGKLLQIDEPKIIYEKPSCSLIANHFGQANILPAKYFGLKNDATVLIRPEKIKINLNAINCTWKNQGKISSILFMGSHLLINLMLYDGTELKLLTSDSYPFAVDSIITIGIDIENVWLIPETI